MRVWITLQIVSLPMLAACSEATDGLQVPDWVYADAAIPEDASEPNDGASDADANHIEPPPSVAINEVSAEGSDWVELLNVGSDVVTLTGFGITDSNDAGEPNKGHVVRFPLGVALEPGAFFVVVADQALPSDGVTTECAGVPVAECLVTDWGISSGNGENVHLVDGDDDAFETATYPPTAVLEGQSWGRLPDGTGAFAANQPTPGAVNVALGAR